MNLFQKVGPVGLFLAILWVFGLLLALDRYKLDETRVLPTMSGLAAERYAIDTVIVKRTPPGKEPEEFTFHHKDEVWTLKKDDQSIKIEGFRIKDMIREARDARRDEEAAVRNQPADYGLAPPQATITFIGTPKKKTTSADDAKDEKKDEKAETRTPREWKLFLGNEDPTKKYVYVASSDRPGRVFAVVKSSISSLFFKNINDLRSKRLFDFNEPIVQSFDLKRGNDEFEAKRTDAGSWLIAKPDLGYGDYEGPPAPKEGGPRPVEGGLKGLINAVAGVRVDSDDDFVPPDPGNLKRYDLEPGKETYRLTVMSGDSKKPTDETLLIGRKEKDYYYARLSTDEGVFKIRAKYLQPIDEAIDNPKKYRNVDLSPVSLKDSDAITIKHGKDEARFFQQGEQKAWQMDYEGKRTGTSAKSVESLIEALQGKRAILSFRDGGDDKKLDAELGLDNPSLVVSVYGKAIDDPKKKDPDFKKDAKPEIVLQFGKVEGDTVAVKRTMADGRVSRFTVAKTVPEKILPKEGFLAYLEMLFPRTAGGDVARVEVDRSGKTTELTKAGDKWTTKAAGGESVPADPMRVRAFIEPFTALPVERWVKKLDPKEDVAAYGFERPTLKVALVEKKDQLTPQTVAVAIARSANPVANPWLTIAAIEASRQSAPGDKATITIGKISTEDPKAYYARHSGSDRLALVSENFVKLAQMIDFRDPSILLNPHAYLVAAAVGSPGLWAASPIVTGYVGNGDASQVQELRVTVRTPIELRSFAFQRQDKSWVDRSGLKEFQPDEAKVTQTANLVVGLQVQRWISLSGGAKADTKLTPADATVTLDAVGKDGKTTTLTIGAEFEGRGYFAQISTMPGAVFLLSADTVRPLLGGAAYFAKERVASAR
jgi:hypothetical protein